MQNQKIYFTSNIFTQAGFTVGNFDRVFSGSFVSNGNYYITKIQIFVFLSTASGVAPITTMQRTYVIFNKNTANFNSGITTNSYFNVMPNPGYISFDFYNLITARETINFTFQMFLNSAAVAGDVANAVININYYSKE